MHAERRRLRQARADGHPGRRLARRVRPERSPAAAVFDEALDRSGALPAERQRDGPLAQARQRRLVPDRLLVGGRHDVEPARPRRAGWRACRARASASRPTTATARRRRSTSSRIDESDVEPACQPARDARTRATGCSSTAPRRAWPSGGCPGPGGFALQPDCSILSFGGLGLLWHPDALRGLQPEARLEDGRRRQRGRLRRLPGSGQRPVQRGQPRATRSRSTRRTTPTRPTGAIYNFKAPDTAARDAALNPPGRVERATSSSSPASGSRSSSTA